MNDGHRQGRAGLPNSAARIGLCLRVRQLFASLVCLTVGDIATYSDRVAAVSVLSNEDAMAFFAGDFHGGVQIVFNVDDARS